MCLDDMCGIILHRTAERGFLETEWHRHRAHNLWATPGTDGVFVSVVVVPAWIQMASVHILHVAALEYMHTIAKCR